MHGSKVHICIFFSLLEMSCHETFSAGEGRLFFYMMYGVDDIPDSTA